MNYLTLKHESINEITINRSRFIGAACPVYCEEYALDFINKYRKKYPDATHHVYAYRLKDNTQRFSDAGEPSGTAGKPVLDVVLKNNITDCVIVVTRYYGGVQLGAGGLVRAYSKSAAAAVEQSGIKQMYLCNIAVIGYSYNIHDSVVLTVNSLGNVIGTEFTDNVNLEFSVEKEKFNELSNALMKLSNGRIIPKIIGEKYI